MSLFNSITFVFVGAILTISNYASAADQIDICARGNIADVIAKALNEYSCRQISQTKLGQLKELKITIKNLALKPGAFSGLNSLEKLSLLGTDIYSIRNINLIDLPLLQHLEIVESRINEISVNDFAEARNLKTLILSRNPITRIENGAFAALGQLENLDLSRNALRSSDFFRCSEVPKLKTLDLMSLMWDGYPLTLTKETLAGCSSLQLLRLGLNLIKEFPSGFFDDLSSLKWLMLSGTQFESAASIKSQSLEMLILNQNRFNILSGADFAELPNLRDLILSGNLIADIRSDVFVSLPKLRRLELDKNGIEQLSTMAFHGATKLESLNLRGNKLSAIDWYGFGTSLKTLDLSQNKISAIPSSAGTYLKSLETLTLDGNQLKAVSQRNFYGMKSLKMLNLARNKITSIDLNGFYGLFSLEQLYLKENSLTKLSYSRAGLRDDALVDIETEP